MSFYVQNLAYSAGLATSAVNLKSSWFTSEHRTLDGVTCIWLAPAVQTRGVVVLAVSSHVKVAVLLGLGLASAAPSI